MEMNKSTWNSEKEDMFVSSITSGLQVENLSKDCGVPFTLTKNTIADGHIYSWNAAKAFYPEGVDRFGSFMDNLKSVGKKVGFDGDVTTMMDQPKIDTLNPNDLSTLTIFDLTDEKLKEFLLSDTYKKDNSIWMLDKPGFGIILKEEDYNKFKNETGKKAAIMYPAADCSVIKVEDKENHFIGLIHAAWQHTSRGLPYAFLKKLENNYGTDLSKLRVYVGPMSTALTYDNLPDDIKNNEVFWPSDFVKTTDENKVKLDFKRAVYNQIINAGVSPSNIKISDANALFDEEYFTHAGKFNGNLNASDGRNAYMMMYNTMNPAVLVKKMDSANIKRI